MRNKWDLIPGRRSATSNGLSNLDYCARWGRVPPPNTKCRNHDRDNSHDKVSRGGIFSSTTMVLATVLATKCRERWRGLSGNPDKVPGFAGNGTDIPSNSG